MKRYGIMLGNKGRRKTVEYFSTPFARNSAAAAYKALGFRVRTIGTKDVRKQNKGQRIV